MSRINMTGFHTGGWICTNCVCVCASAGVCMHSKGKLTCAAAEAGFTGLL